MLLLLVLLSAHAASSRGLPASPCPRVFQYELREGEGWFGHLLIPTLRPGAKLHVAVRMFVNTALPNAQYGRLRLRGDRDEVARRVFHQTSTTAEYEVHFPAQSPLPQVEQISVNNAVICQGSPATSRVSVSTKIFLEHNLYPVVKQSPPDPPVGGPRDGDIWPRGGLRNEAEPCGVAASGVRPLVARGTPIERGEWPWLAALYLSEKVKFVCAGTLINLRHVITAGHCIRGRDGLTKAASDVVVVLGKHDITKWVEPRNQNRVITEIRVHPDFNYLTLANDIAALVLESRVEYTLVVRPVCLWDSDEDLDRVVGRVATVVGWGHDETGGTVTDRPNKVGVTIVSQQQCLRSHSAFLDFTTEKTICAGDKDGSGPCSGDSGGPLLLDTPLGVGGKQWHLRGIISLALTDRVNMTCDLHEYVVYTDVAKYLQWLKQFTLD